MKRTLTLALGVALLCGAGVLLHSNIAVAADEPFNPDCHLDAINAGLDAATDQIKSSPAAGHAGGHYKKAIDDIAKIKEQLHKGCRAWNKDQKPTTPAKP